MMEFKLFYKSYEYKPSLDSIKRFKEATGKDLWSSLIKYMVCFVDARKNGDSISEMMHKLADVLDFVEASQVFYCLAKQSIPTLTIDEIEDAMFHAGILPNDSQSGMCEPYPLVLYKIALDVQDYHHSLANEKKPSADS